MFFAGQPFYLLNLFIQGVGYHLQWFVELTFNTQAFEQEGFYATARSKSRTPTNWAPDLPYHLWCR